MTTSDEPNISASSASAATALRARPSAPTSASTKWPARKRKSLDANVPAEVPPKAATVKVSRVKKAVESKAVPKTTLRTVESNGQMNIDCFDELMGKRSEICAKENIQCHHFLSNAAISEISKKLPKTMESLKTVKGLEDRQISRFGSLIVDICSKHS